MTQLPAVNLDQLSIHRFAEAGGAPEPIDTNPVTSDLGGMLHAVDRAGRSVVLRFAFAERHLQGNGVVAGGLVTTALDFAMAFAALAALAPPDVAVSVSMHVEFRKAVAAGEVEVRGRVERLGARLAFCSARLVRVGAPEDILAGASSVMAVIR